MERYLHLGISLENDVFQDEESCAQEIVRIIRHAAKKIEEDPDLLFDEEIELRDINGNTVGAVSIENLV